MKDDFTQTCNDCYEISNKHNMLACSRQFYFLKIIYIYRRKIKRLGIYPSLRYWRVDVVD